MLKLTSLVDYDDPGAVITCADCWHDHMIVTMWWDSERYAYVCAACAARYGVTGPATAQVADMIIKAAVVADVAADGYPERISLMELAARVDIAWLSQRRHETSVGFVERLITAQRFDREPVTA